MTQQTKELYEILQNEEIEQEEKEQILSDMLESFGADEKVEAYCQVIGQYKAELEAYEKEIKRLEAKKKTAKNAVERMKEALKNFLEATGETKVETGTFTVSLRESKSVDVFDLEQIPQEFLRIKVEADKKAIGDLLKKGETVSGAQIVVNKGVNIK
jgi:hypothetical protein